MASTYLPLQLVHAHLPAPPSIPLAIPELRIPTDRPFPESSQAYSEPLHPDHAVSAVHHQSTGTLARVIRNGFVLELRTLNAIAVKDRRRDGTGSEIIRIAFPDRLLSLTQGCLVLSPRENKLFILVVTESTVVYRLSFPLGGFKADTADRLLYTTKGDDWCEEYEVPDEVINACGGVGSWIVLDDATVVLGGDDGGIVRLVRSGARNTVYWTAAHYRPSAGFRLPSLFSRSHLDEQVVSFAKLTGDSSGPLVYALSRGHRLRVWNIDSGTCIKTIDVRPTTSTEMILQSETTRPRSASSSSSAPADGATLIRVIPHPSTTSRYSHLVIVFFASPSTSSSAGSFVVYRASTSNGAVDLTPAGARQCSASSAGSSLRGFEVVAPYVRDGINTGWRLQVVWDHRGSSLVETVVMDDIFQFTTYLEHPSSFLLTDWQIATKHTDVERYDAAYFDNLLGSESPDATKPDDNSDIVFAFIDHLFYPCRFSILNLTTALDEYIHTLSRQRSAQIVSAANGLPTLQRRFAAIVGCELRMESDASTGAPVIDAYRRELKLEWLGIWARVRDLDRQGRWPLSTATTQDQMLILTREGVSVPVRQDTTGLIARFAQTPEEAADFRALPEGALRHLYPKLAAPKARSGAIALSSVGNYIASVLRSNSAEEGEVNALEDVAVGLKSMFAGGIQQPIEVLGGEIWDDPIEPYLSDEDRTAVRRILSECLDVRRAIQEGLAILMNHSSAEATHTAIFSGFGNALITSTAAAIIADRYAAARNLLFVVLFHLSETPDIMHEDDDHEALLELLYRCFSVCHRFSVFKWVSEQTAEELNEHIKLKKSTKRKTPGADDNLAEGLGSLQVGDDEGAQDGFDPSYSLLHTLLDGQSRQAVPPPSIDMVFTAAFGFLESTGVITENTFEIDPSLADIRLGYSILANGLPSLAGRFADLYPLSAGMAYIRGRAALHAGITGEAVRSFEQAAMGCKDGSISKILPMCTGMSEFYRHIANLFADNSQDAPVAHFGQLAILTLPPDAQPPKGLWTTVFLANVGLGQYEDAYAILTKTPYLDLQRDFLGQLISVMCEANEVGRLNQLSFIGLQNEVENLLSYKARNSNPLRFPNYYKVLYSWYISRGDYRSAGDIMHQQGRRFADSRTSKLSAFELTAMQARSYLTAINALKLVEKCNAWISVPGPPPRALHGSKRRRISSYVPEEEFSKDKRPINIITLADIEMEYALVLTKLRLSSQIQEPNEHGISLSPEEAIGLLVQRNMFDLALSAASTMQVDMTDIFITIATRCVELSRVSDIRGDSSAATWLHTSPLTSRLRGSPAALALRYLQTTLSQHDSTRTHFVYREIVADTLFELNRDKSMGWQMPAWLVEWEMERDPERWISSAVKWGWVEEAVDWSSELLRRAVPPELLPKKSDVANVPYNLIDRVIAAAGEGDEKDDNKVQGKVKALREAVERRLEGLKKLEGR